MGKIKNQLEKVIQTYGSDEAENIIEGLYELTGSFEKTLEIICDGTFRKYYTDITNYSHLAEAILNDEAFLNSNTDKVLLDFLSTETNEAVLKEHLEQLGWHISDSGFATILE